MRSPVIALGFLAALAILPSSSRAEWPLNGAPVCVMTGAQSNALCAPDGSGGAVVLWTDERRGAGLIDLYGTRILGDGTIAPGWPDGGAAITTTGDATEQAIVGDGTGGLMAFWLDNGTRHAHMQHLDGSGALAPGFAAGGTVLPFNVGGPAGWLVFAVTDGTGGAFVLWNTYDGLYDRLLMTRVDGTGAFAPGWSAAGITQLTSDPFSAPSTYSVKAVDADPSGGAVSGALIHYEDPEGGGGAIGNFARTGPDGGPVLLSGSPYPPTTGAIAMVADGVGGMFTSWSQSTGRFVQHVLANGSAAWPAAALVPVSDLLLRDGSGGIYLLGTSTSAQLSLHRRAADASIPSPWTSAGVVVSHGGPFLTEAAVVSGGLVYSAWTVGTAGAYNVRASAVTSDGSLVPGWPSEGELLSTAANARVMTSMIALPPSDALVVWADARSGDADVYASRLAPPGPVPLDVPTARHPGFALDLSPNPAGSSARVSLTLPEAGATSVEIVDVSGRMLIRLEAEPRSGEQSLSVDTASLPGGLYWARLRQNGRTTATRFAVVH